MNKPLLLSMYPTHVFYVCDMTMSNLVKQLCDNVIYILSHVICKSITCIFSRHRSVEDSILNLVIFRYRSFWANYRYIHYIKQQNVAIHVSL